MSTMICLAGLPGSGKTTWSKKFLEQYPNVLYFSPDAYYERINGDDRDRKNTFEIWMSMFRDIHTAELTGRDVIIDSDNLTYAQRNQWIEWFPGFDKHFLLFIDEDLCVCLDRVSKRRRTVPEDIMREKYRKWENPLEAGDCADWDEVREICDDLNDTFV